MRAISGISKVILLSLPLVAVFCEDPTSPANNGSVNYIPHPLTGIWAMVKPNSVAFKAFDWFTVPSMRGYVDTLAFYSSTGEDVPSNSEPLPYWTKLNWMRIGTPLSNEDFFTGTYPSTDIFSDKNTQADPSQAQPSSRSAAYWDAYQLTKPLWPYLYGTSWTIDASASYGSRGSNGNLEIWHYAQGTTPATVTNFYSNIYYAWCDSMRQYRGKYDTLYMNHTVNNGEAEYLYGYLRSQKDAGGGDVSLSWGSGQEAALIQHGILVKDSYKYEIKNGSNTLTIRNNSGDVIEYRKLAESEIPSKWKTIISSVSSIKL
jgi:hypothetical protein